MTGAAGATWYTATLDPGAFPYINVAGTTQFRCGFALDDNDDHDQDYMKFYSGNATSEDQPVLTINYHLKTGGSPSVIAILRADSDPTVASSRRFTVAFSEPVTGVDLTDFTLTTTGGISGAAVTGISGSGDTYTLHDPGPATAAERSAWTWWTTTASWTGQGTRWAGSVWGTGITRRARSTRYCV